MRERGNCANSEIGRSQNVCLCRHNQNVNLLLSACNGAGLNILVRKLSSDFVKVVVCNDDNEQGMLTNVCNVCRDCKLFDAMVDSYECHLLADTVTWYQWEIEDQRAVKSTHESTISDALIALKLQLQPSAPRKSFDILALYKSDYYYYYYYYLARFDRSQHTERQVYVTSLTKYHHR